jgi:hypothetical protein
LPNKILRESEKLEKTHGRKELGGWGRPGDRFVSSLEVLMARLEIDHAGGFGGRSFDNGSLLCIPVE